MKKPLRRVQCVWCENRFSVVEVPERLQMVLCGDCDGPSWESHDDAMETRENPIAAWQASYLLSRENGVLDALYERYGGESRTD